jgi:hypothetical protein
MATNANSEFDKQDSVTDDPPQGSDTIDDTYASSSDDSLIPVLKDEQPVEQPCDMINADSNKMIRIFLSLTFCIGAQTFLDEHISMIILKDSAKGPAHRKR